MYLVYQTTPASPTKAQGTGAKPNAVPQGPAPQSGDMTSQTISSDAPPLPLTMNPILWIGLFFTAGLVAVQIYTLYRPPVRGSQGRKTMRVLSSLCCGFAGGFLTGAAIFNATFTHALGKVGISGSAGIALFFAVFFFYGDDPPPGEIDGPNGVTLTIAPGCKFRDVADIVAAQTQAGMDYRALNADELGAAMRAQPVNATSWEQLLESLRNVTVTQVIRPYTVKKQNGSYVFKL